MPSVGRRLASATRSLVVLLLLLASASVVAPVQASPGPFPVDLPDGEPGVTLAWPTLGLPRAINFAAADSRQEFQIPEPIGLNAVRLRGVIRPPANLGAGYLEIDDSSGTFLAAVNLPPASAETGATPLDIDISAARTQASAVNLQFTLRQLGATEMCGPTPELTIGDLAVDFAGVEPAPSTIATFFPPVLERVAIYVPVDADTGEQQAALTLVSTLTRFYAPQPVAITVVSQPRGAAPPPAAQLARAIVVERGSASLSVVNPLDPTAYLRLSGRGDEITSQVSLLENQLQSLVQVPDTRVDQAGTRAIPTGDTLTFGQLRVGGRSDVLRSSNLTVGVDRAALGSGRIDNVRVHLIADYTPVARDDTATVVVRSNGLVVYSALLDNTGRVDATFDLNGQTLTQRINLDFVLSDTPHQGCGQVTVPMAFEINPRSTVTMRRNGPALGSFDALPSEFAPKFLVALDGSSQNQLGYAARVVGAIARLTTTPLTPKVVDVKAAAESDTGALIVANSNSVKQTSLNPPVSGDGSATSIDLSSALRANITDGLGSIQAFADPGHHRTVVLITTTGAWKLVDPLFDYIDGLSAGWSQLTGDVLAAGTAGAPTDLSIRGDDGILPAAPSGRTIPWIGIATGAGVLVLVAIVAAWLWLRRPNGSGHSSKDA